MTVRIQAEDFDIAKELEKVMGAKGEAGALVSFTGLVRGGKDLKFLELEHYPDMTEKALLGIEAEAKERWDLVDSLIIHRFGKLELGEKIMMVAVSSAHRQASFEAADFMMDFLKSRAPFWKKEHSNKNSFWVDAKADDEKALRRWLR